MYMQLEWPVCYGKTLALHSLSAVVTLGLSLGQWCWELNALVVSLWISGQDQPQTSVEQATNGNVSVVSSQWCCSCCAQGWQRERAKPLKEDQLLNEEIKSDITICELISHRCHATIFYCLVPEQGRVHPQQVARSSQGWRRETNSHNRTHTFTPMGHLERPFT